MYCQAISSQFQSVTQPSTLLAGWEGSNSLETTYILFELPYQGLRKVDGKMCAERNAASWVRFVQFLDLFVHFVRVWDKAWSKSYAITLWVDALCVSSSAILCTLLDSGGKLTSSITRFYTWGKNRGKVIFPCYVVIIIWLYIVRVVMVTEF